MLAVPTEYIEDDFNLAELQAKTGDCYEDALDVLLDEYIDDYSPTVERAASLLYSLIHQRYVISKQGLAKMAERYVAGDFGVCPRILCEGTNVVPAGVTDIPGQHAMKLFCPKCKDLFYPASTKFHGVDGCAWGSSFASLFFLTFPHLLPDLLDCPEDYVPKVYGFALHPSSPAALVRKKNNF